MLLWWEVLYTILQRIKENEKKKGVRILNSKLFLVVLGFSLFLVGCQEQIAPIFPSPDTLRVLNCSSGAIPEFDGTNWGCGVDDAGNASGQWQLSLDGWLINDSGLLNWNVSKGDARYYLASNPSEFINLSSVEDSGYVNDSSGVIALFSGCSGTQYLGADGSCHDDSDTPDTNETARVNSLITSNASTNARIYAINASKLNESDQRYNDTSLIESLNISKLNASDQRYNDTALIDSVNATAQAKASPGTCANGYAVQNTTTGGVECIEMPTGTGTGEYNITLNLTSSTYNGDQDGYNGTNAICNAEFPGSHLCSGHEILNFISKGESYYSLYADSAWYATFSPKYIPATVPVDDCNGFTYSGTSTHLGTYWKWNDNSYGGAGKAINCGTSLKLACCKNE